MLRPLSLEQVCRDFIGLDTRYPLADGRITRRCYFDSAASTLALRSARQVADDLLRHYANTHSQAHFSARIVNHAYAWAHRQVLSFIQADPDHYAVFFAGSGCTAPLNRLARTLATQRPERDVVLVSLLEHHANDLPHRKHAGQVIHIPLSGDSPMLGAVDLAALERLLGQYRGRVNYVAVSAASNVTGVRNPIYDIAALAHDAGAWIVVDASQHVAHAPLAMNAGAPARALDVVVFSGHKVYAPGSPGVAVVRRSLLDDCGPDEVGGGMVEDVHLNSYQIASQFPDREEAGTPNLIGAVQLGAALRVLQRIGMKRIHAVEQQHLRQLFTGLATIPGVRIYGDPDLDRTPRLGTVAFNVNGLEHGLIAAALNDYHNIAVRNGCFCAHPYVRELLKPELWALDVDPDAEDAIASVQRRQGMVRASLGLYVTDEDVATLLAGVYDLQARPEYYRMQYEISADGDFRHRASSAASVAIGFDPEVALDQALARLSATSDLL